MWYALTDKTAFSRFLSSIGLVALAACLCLPAFAVNPDRLISQYAHTTWRIHDGSLPGMPYSIAQTVDGYLWIGTRSGIVRFDGVRFVPWAPPGGEPLRTAGIISLLGASDGSLWIGTLEDGLWNWKDRRLTSYLMSVKSGVSSILDNGDESVWIARKGYGDSQGSVCEAASGQIHCYRPKGIPFDCCFDLAKDGVGELWMGGGTELVKWKPNSASADTSTISGAIENQTETRLIALPDGSALVGVDVPGRGRGLQRYFQGRWAPFISSPWDSSSVGVRTLLMDRHNVLWVGTTGQGLYRIRDGKVDHFGKSEGLSGDYVTELFEDHEGNLWVTTYDGVDCFRDLPVVRFSPSEGLGALQVDTVLAAREGTVWAGGDRGLDVLYDGKVSTLRTVKTLPGVQVTSLLEDHAGRMWVGLDHTMSILQNGKFTEIKRPNGQPMGFVVGITEDTENDVWIEVSAKPRELIQVRDLLVKKILPAPEMPAARKVAADPRGGIWLGLLSGDLARYQDGKIEVFHFQHLTPSEVNQIAVNPDGSVFGATGYGLIAWRDRKQQILSTLNGLPCEKINSLVRDVTGALWLFTQCGLVQISEQELQRWWGNSAAVLHMRVFDALDGVLPGWSPFQGAARTSDGKLWFANEGPLQMIDPLHLPVNTIPPPVHVEEATADRHSFLPGTDLHFPALTRDVAIRYTALSYVAPQKVRFRYMLEGQDKTWQEAGTRREAFYTNLAPRSYRFRVIACNNDGLWNETGDILSFTIAPAYYQTNWFIFLCTGAFLGGLWLLYLLRLKQATAQIQQRIGTRLEERERIARELHDTLLQGFQGLMLRFQAAMKTTLSDPKTAHQMMEKALDRADEVLLEGRQRVRDLREEGLLGDDLLRALSQCGEDLSQDHSSEFSLSVQGTTRPLDPIVFNDVTRIAKEALINAFRHAEASKIESELAYSDAGVCLRIRDDGSGIDPVILNGGKIGHWGLSGMRERAEKIGAQLKIRSQVGTGTEIDLTVPAKVAYLKTPKATRKEPLWSRVRPAAREPEVK
jgi:ligand-binding sensor domain-containing protein/signal transduction histidine kinase